MELMFPSALLRCSIQRSIFQLPSFTARYSTYTVPNDIGILSQNDGSVQDRDEPPSAPGGSYDPPDPNRNPLKVASRAGANPRAGLAALTPARYRLHLHSSRNNTIATFTRPNGKTLAWFSGGSCGFKKGNRASYEAGYQCAVRMFKRIEEETKQVTMELELFFKGFGQGRDALQRALLTSEGDVVRPLVATITDRTPIKIGGTRAKKKRRL
jgi:small subunit ribosomal protein S11